MRVILAHLIEIPSKNDQRGSIKILDKLLPFEIKRIFFITQPKDIRGGHRHKKSIQALICLRGSCLVEVDDGLQQKNFFLDSDKQCLILEPEDWHTMSDFKDDPILLVASSQHYDKNDYIHEPYE